MSDRTLKGIFFGIILLIGGIASRSIGRYVLDSTTNTTFAGIGKPIGDILVIIGNSILAVFLIGVMVVAAIIFLDYYFSNQSGY